MAVRPKGTDRDRVVSGVEAEIEKLIPLIQDIFYGFEDEHTIEEQIGLKLQQRNQFLAVAESCTGGQIAQMSSYEKPPGHPVSRLR